MNRNTQQSVAGTSSGFVSGIGSSLWGGLVTVACICVPMTQVAHADQFVDSANASFGAVSKDRRSDLVLLPLLAKMDQPPREASDPLPAALMDSRSKNWAAASAWASAKPQQDVIEAVKKVTSEDDWRKAWAFAQPYGANAVEPEIVASGLYTELGENPTLAAAEFKYLPAIRKLESLVHIEATRLYEANKAAEALNLMRRWVYFARSMCDRQFLVEVEAGYEMLSLGLQRLRDIAFVDMRSGAPKLSAEVLKVEANKLDDRGVLGLRRLSLPIGDRLAAEQIVLRTFTANGGPSESLGVTLATVRAGDRPLRMFSEAAKWESAGFLHANQTASVSRIKGVFSDWSTRWELSDFDPLNATPSELAKTDRAQFAVPVSFMGNLGNLFPLRSALRAEAAGTRTALGLEGFHRTNNGYPRELTGIAPAFVRAVDDDPFDKAARERQGKRLQFFVPGRETPNPVQEIRVFPRVSGVDYPNFVVPIKSDTCVVYSAGPDGNHNNARLATQGVKDDRGDYLLWPPVLSLLRQNLVDTNQMP